MRSIEGVGSTRSPRLARALREWTRCILDYSRALEWKDAAWWYNERASLSTFSAAVWRAGGVALEEYSTLKRWGRARRTGRCDLYFQFPGERFAAEAKFMWSNLGPNLEGQVDRVGERLDWACRDATRIDEGARRFGMLCVSTSMPVEYGREVDARIEKWLDRLRSLPSFAMAWSFPRQMRRWKPKHRGQADRLYPGCALILRLA